MKKFLINLSLIILLLWGTVFASDLKFTPDGGGRFIYCNNNEFIRREHLADTSNPNPEYLMSNPDMGEGKYTIYFSHVNHTELMKYPSPYPDTAEMPKDIENEELLKLNEIKEPGFAIEVDVRFKANEDTTLKITALGFEVQEERDYYLNNRLVQYEDPWGCLNAVADYFKMPIYTQGSEYKYLQKEFLEKEIFIKKGEVFWLSEVIENYASAGWLKPVHLLCDFTIEKGNADINIAALKSGSILKKRGHLAPNPAHGRYYRDGQYKGVADSLPSVTASLEYEIDDSVADGDKLPVTIFNQYVPKGLEVKEWHTNINPQNDSLVRRSAAESDILPLTYKDLDKLSLYKEGAENKSEVWIFDVYHSATRTDAKGPNYELDPSKYNVGKSVGLANYCVKNNYKLKIKNNGDTDRYFNYNAKTTSDLIVWVTDSEGKRQNPYLTSKGYSDRSEWETLASVKLPKGEVTEFTLTTFLPINHVGAILNSFTVSSSPFEFQYYEDLKQGDVRDENYTGKNYVIYNKDGFLVSEDRKIARKFFADEDVKKIFENDQTAWKIRHFGENYFVYYGDFVETPAYYSARSLEVAKVYILDEDFHLVGSVDFGKELGAGFPFMYSFAGGKMYIRGGCTMASADLENWERIYFLDENKFMLPLDNQSGIILLPKEGGEYYISPDNGENYYLIEYPPGAKKPRYAEVMGDMFFYAEKNMLYTSRDGLYWQGFDAGEEITRLSREGEEFSINKDLRYTPPKTEVGKNVIIGDRLIIFPEGTIENPSDVLVPLERIFGEAKIEFTYEKSVLAGEKSKVYFEHNGREYELGAGSNAVYVDGKRSYLNNSCIKKDGIFYVPAKDLFSFLGFECEYFEKSKILVIK